jgi:hypothetical protein
MPLNDRIEIDSEVMLGEGSIDSSLIDHTLSLSYEERIEAHESARQLVNDLQEAGKKYRAEQSQTIT